MIPFLDLQAQHRALAPELEGAFARVIRDCHFVLGPEVEAFEESFARWCRTRHAVAVNSGTSALHLALLAAGIGPGDEVITTTMTFVASVASILYTGATPILVDIEPRSRTLDVALVAQAIGPRTKAIMPVHLHGGMADMDPIMALAAKHGLAVIEDAAQAHGAECRGRRAGSIGDLGCFSFYPGKNLGACGEGGAVVTDNAQLASIIRRLRDWGQIEKYQHTMQGYNFRMDALQAACLQVKLPHVETWAEKRRRHAVDYDRLLAGGEIGLPQARPDQRHVYHVYAVQVPDRDAIRRSLHELGVATSVHYPAPIHLQPAYPGLGQPGDFPVAERFAAETLSLPIYPELTSAQTAKVAECLLSIRASQNA